MTGLSLGEGMPSPLQVAGPKVSCQHVLQVVGPNVAELAGVVQPPAAGFTGMCEQPSAASWQVVGQHVVGAYEQPPASSLQVAGLHV